MSEYNKAHGASVVKVLPNPEKYLPAFTERTLRDELFELIYAEHETFADGRTALMLCWRETCPKFLADDNPKYVAPKNRPTVTQRRPFVWF